MKKTAIEKNNRTPGKSTKRMMEEWKALYLLLFGIRLNIEKIRIPKKKRGFDRLIIVARGVTPNRAFSACEKLFPSFCGYSDLNATTQGQNEREAKQDYAIWVRDDASANKENEGITYSELKEKGETYITLVERMLFELKYFLETGEHMDMSETYTTCAGSRDSDGDVPYVYWDRGDSEMYVDAYDPDSSDSGMRARRAVVS